ncbi:Unknown protein [Striga hermonthica]|uniref:Uncharacterized protein n=1 Tax=Striga hermonthica TaxID=68872 RepID=A0A9N7MKZ2_STRHE|nr:Unknown protein [Striga hermonthica]
MEERCSVNSPRRILSFSKNRRANVSFPDDADGRPGFEVSGEHDPKPSEGNDSQGGPCSYLSPELRGQDHYPGSGAAKATQSVHMNPGQDQLL